jgi:hypothetical protein
MQMALATILGLIALRMPATGLSTDQYEFALGKRVITDLASGAPLMAAALE